MSRWGTRLVVLTSAVCTASNLACRREPAGEPVATLTVTLNHERVITGSVLEAMYRFDVAPNTSLLEDYRVFVHMIDDDGELLWGDDHDPPIPTTAWRAAQMVEYTRTNVVPPLSYIGDATLQVGLFSTKTQHRLPLKADHVRHGAYRVAHLQVRPETDGPVTVFKDGWHLLEASTANGGGVQWRWTKHWAILAFQNPRVDSWLYLDLDSPLAALHQAQHVQLSMGGQVLDAFTLLPDVRSLAELRPSARERLGE